MVGVHVRLQRPAQAQTELLDERNVAPGLLEHRVDHHRLARCTIRHEIGIC
jgi:hypothetical protein